MVNYKTDFQLRSHTVFFDYDDKDPDPMATRPHAIQVTRTLDDPSQVLAVTAPGNRADPIIPSNTDNPFTGAGRSTSSSPAVLPRPQFTQFNEILASEAPKDVTNTPIHDAVTNTPDDEVQQQPALPSEFKFPIDADRLERRLSPAVENDEALRTIETPTAVSPPGIRPPVTQSPKEQKLEKVNHPFVPLINPFNPLTLIELREENEEETATQQTPFPFITSPRQSRAFDKFPEPGGQWLPMQPNSLKITKNRGVGSVRKDNSGSTPPSPPDHFLPPQVSSAATPSQTPRPRNGLGTVTTDDNKSPFQSPNSAEQVPLPAFPTTAPKLRHGGFSSTPPSATTYQGQAGYQTTAQVHTSGYQTTPQQSGYQTTPSGYQPKPQPSGYQPTHSMGMGGSGYHNMQSGYHKPPPGYKKPPTWYLPPPSHIKGAKPAKHGGYGVPTETGYTGGETFEFTVDHELHIPLGYPKKTYAPAPYPHHPYPQPQRPIYIYNNIPAPATPAPTTTTTTTTTTTPAPTTTTTVPLTYHIIPAPYTNSHQYAIPQIPYMENFIIQPPYWLPIGEPMPTGYIPDGYVPYSR